MKKTILLIICALIFTIADAQWQEINNGLYGGQVSTLAVDPVTNYMYA